jgi:hypothetical protein
VEKRPCAGYPTGYMYLEFMLLSALCSKLDVRDCSSAEPLSGAQHRYRCSPSPQNELIPWAWSPLRVPTESRPMFKLQRSMYDGTMPGTSHPAHCRSSHHVRCWLLSPHFVSAPQSSVYKPGPLVASTVSEQPPRRYTFSPRLSLVHLPRHERACRIASLAPSLNSAVIETRDSHACPFEEGHS